MIQIILPDLPIRIDNFIANDSLPISEQTDFVPLEAIIPLIEEEWKNENYTYGELYDSMYSKLSERAAQLRQHLQSCKDARLYQQIEQALADVEAELCELSLKFDELPEYPL